MNTVTTKQAYENLANAIIIKAVKDYTTMPKRYKSNCLRFFRSDWYKCLTDLPPDVIIKICEKRLAKGKTNVIHMTKGKI